VAVGAYHTWQGRLFVANGIAREDIIGADRLGFRVNPAMSTRWISKSRVLWCISEITIRTAVGTQPANMLRPLFGGQGMPLEHANISLRAIPCSARFEATAWSARSTWRPCPAADGAISPLAGRPLAHRAKGRQESGKRAVLTSRQDPATLAVSGM